MTRAARRLTLGAALAGAALAAAACAERVVGADPPRDPAAVFDAAWRAYDREYPFFVDQGLDWDRVRAEARPRVPAAPGTPAADSQLFDAVCALVRATGSLHSTLVAEQGFRTRVCTADAGRRRPTFDPRLVRDRYLRATSATRGGHLIYALFPSFFTVDAASRPFGAPGPAIGYVDIPSFGGEGWGGQIDDVVAALQAQLQAQLGPAAIPLGALVFDVRRNGGGNEAVAREIAARFVDAERVYALDRVRTGPARDALSAPEPARLAPAGSRFAGRVVVLTDGGTASAAEDFVLMLRQVPGVVVVGDTSSGTSGRPLPRQLPNGWWLRVPAAMRLTADGALVIEGRGLPPTRAVRALLDDVAIGRDRALEAALSVLTGFPTFP